MAARTRRIDATPPQATTPRLLAVGRSPIARACSARLFGRCGVQTGTGEPGGPAGDPIVVAISGGADSTALLLLLASIARRRSSRGVRIVAAHVHHHLRGSADDDLTFVEQLCAAIRIPLSVRHVHPKGARGNLAAAARELRYQALIDVAHESRSRFVATAHHADDQAETVLMHVLRGASWRGLAAIPWRRRLSDDVDVIRPLLGVRHAQCESLCTAAGVTWRRDPSNADTDRARAKLRHDVLPVLESIWPGAADRLAALADDAGQLCELIDHLVELRVPATSRWPREDLRQLPPVVLGEGLRRAALLLAPAAGDALDRDLIIQAIEAIRDQERRPRTLRWPGGITLKITAAEVSITQEQSLKTPQSRI